MYKRRSQGWTRHLDFILLDALVLQLAFVIAYMLRNGGAGLPYQTASYRSLAMVYTTLDVLVAAAFDTMRGVLRRDPWRELAQTARQTALVLVAMALYLFVVQAGSEYSRAIVLLTAAFHLALGYGARLLWKRAVTAIAEPAERQRVLLVADERQVAEVLSRVGADDPFRYCGLVLTNRDATGEEVCGLPVVAALDTAAAYICREWVDGVLVCPTDMSAIRMADSEWDGNPPDHARQPQAQSGAPGSARLRDEGISQLIADCRQMAVPTHVRIPLSGVGGYSFVEEMGGCHVVTTTCSYASPAQLAAKRALDIVGGLMGSLVAVIVIAVLTPQIKRESPGPVLFSQVRVGQNGRRFRIYKIRSMYMDAEEHKAELQADNRVSDGMMFKLDWDPRIIGNKVVDGERVTGIGERIRSGSWDEWPQFFNVLMGQMSLVGTRPPTEDEWERYQLRHRARLATKPGITGMWQVSGRSNVTDFDEVVRLDTEYINGWSIGMDLKILAKTVKVVLDGDGAM